MAIDLPGLEAANNLPSGLLSRVIGAESSGNPSAVSAKGATGLMQLMPSTAKMLGVDPRDPAQNVAGGARYLGDLAKRFGPFGALVAYHEGPGRYAKGTVLPQSAAYADKVLGMTDISGVAPSPLIPPSVLEQQIPGISAVLASAQRAARQTPEYQSVKSAADRVHANADRIQTDVDEREQRLHDLENAPDEPLPPPARLQDLPQAPNVAAKDPTRALGQALPLLAVFGAMGVRHNAHAAIDAMTGAINGMHDGDLEVAHAKQQEFEDHFKQVEDQNRIEIERRNQVLGDRKLTATERLAKLRMFALEQGDGHLLAQTGAGDLNGAAATVKMMDNATKAASEAVRGLRSGAKDLQKHQADLAYGRFVAKYGPTNREAWEAFTTDNPKAGGKDEDAFAASQRQFRGGGAAGGGGKAWTEEDKMRHDLTAKGTPGAAYMALRDNAAKIKDAADHPENYLTPSGSAIVADTFTRAFNGGNAIRGFQAKMLSDDRSLANNIQGYLQRAESGGKFTPQEIRQMASAVLRVQPELKGAWDGALGQAQQVARSRGLNTDAILPFGMGDEGASGAAAPHGAPSDAKQASDGHWYSPDPKRPGKYIRWDN